VWLPAGGAVATSTLSGHTWLRGGEVVHHIVDPRTGTSARTPWVTVSAVASRCVEANTLTTAALVRGAEAVRWLDRVGATARLVHQDGTVVTTGDWPDAP
jgi:thiamine biosynthesis lipoprotein